MVNDEMDDLCLQMNCFSEGVAISECRDMNGCEDDNSESESDGNTYHTAQYTENVDFGETFEKFLLDLVSQFIKSIYYFFCKSKV